MTETPRPRCAWCGHPVVPPYGVIFMQKHFCCAADREKYRYAEEARETGRHPSGEWMQNLRRPDAAQ
jgi:hypothetical protein